MTTQLVERYALSPNWRDGQFQNLEPTALTPGFRKLPEIICKQLSSQENKEPKAPLPIIPLDHAAFLAPSDQTKMIWYGHSVVLLRTHGLNLLIDPMLGPDTSPIAPVATKRFSENTLDLIDDFPEIDLVLITHDHYDHLDFASIQRLRPKVKQYYVALGLKRHLVAWGVAPDVVTEFDWWDEKTLQDLKITYTPTRHFSGRGLTDRQKCLWGGWVLTTPTENIWFSGDGGYGQHFKTIGERLGPFDFAFMECGQYNDDWRPIHLFPDEAVQAALDAGVKKAMPVHWCGFALSYQHGWSDPPAIFRDAAEAQGLPYSLPRLGQCFTAGDLLEEAWFETKKAD